MTPSERKEPPVKKTKVLDVVLLVLKVLIPVVLLAAVVFFSYRLIEGHIFDLQHRGEESYHSGMGLYVFASHVVLACVNAVMLIPCITGLVIAHKHRGTPARDQNVRTFRALIFTPLLSQVLYFWVSLIVLSIG